MSLRFPKRDGGGVAASLAKGSAGGVLIYDAGGNPVELARGADTGLLILPVGGGPPQWITNSAAEYNTVAGQNIPANTTTILNYGTKVTDTDNAVTVGAAWHFTCQAGKGGDYLITACGAFSASPGAGPALLLYKNGARTHDLFNAGLTTGATYVIGMGVAGAAIVTLAVGDTIDVRIFQNSAGAVTLQPNAFQNRIAIRRLP